MGTGIPTVLEKRLLTGVPLAIGVLAIIAWAPSGVVSAVMAAAMLIAAWEWADLAGLRGTAARFVYVGGVAGLIALAALVALPIQSVWQVPGLLWWLGVAVWLLDGARRPSPLALPVWLRALAGVVTLTLAWVSVTAIHMRPGTGALWLTVLVVLVWGADIGGYFAGRRYGRRKLAPRISPGKTWEGVAGGLALALTAMLLLIAAAGGTRAGFPGYGWLLPVAVLVIALSVVGDLAESLLKRQAGRKDSGRLLPGHGGLLDRVDALLAAAPVLAGALAGVP